MVVLMGSFLLIFFNKRVQPFKMSLKEGVQNVKKVLGTKFKPHRTNGGSRKNATTFKFWSEILMALS
jgi:hypothetical protein